MTESRSVGEASAVARHEVDPPPPAAGWRESRWLAAGELAAVALIFLLDLRHLIPVSKTLFLLLLGWISLRLRGERWRGVGLARYRSWQVTLALGIAAGVAMEAFELFASQPFLVWLTGKQPDLHRLRSMQGNVKTALVWLASLWVIAAFGEELVYRGYLLNRIAGLGQRTRLAWACSVLAVSTLFGLAHAYQGVTGIVDEGLMGLLLALLYLGTGRNLAVPIVAHGIQDSIDIVLIFLGRFPGM